MRLTHVRLLVDDYAACFRFYRDVMRWPVTFGDEESSYADFDAGADVALAIFERREQAEQVSSRVEAFGDRAALIVLVDDVDAALDALRGRGAAVVSDGADRADWGIRVAYVRDPDDNLIELNRPLAE